MAALTDDLAEVTTIIGRLADEEELDARADLGVELLRVGAILEEVREQALYPALADRVPEVVAEATARSAEVRDRIVALDVRMRNVSPIDVHEGDPEGVERDLGELAETMRAELVFHAAVVEPAVARLPVAEQRALADGLAGARRHASERSRSGGTLLRIVRTTSAKLNMVADHPTEYRTAVKDGELSAE